MTHPYVARRPGTANLYFHRIVPAALRPYFDGPTQYWKSLGTPKRKEAYKEAAKESVKFNEKLAAAEAKRALGAAAKEAADFVAASCRTGLAPEGSNADAAQPAPLIASAPEPRVLDENAVPTLAQRFAHFSLQTDDEERQALSNEEIIARRTEMDYAQDQLSLAGAAERCAYMAESADALLEAENMTADPNSQAYQLLLKALLDADLSVIAEQVARLRGKRTQTPKEAPPLSADCDNWNAMLQAWKEKRAPNAKTYDETTSIVERFQQKTGNPPVHQINAEHIKRFKNQLRDDGISPSRINTVLALLRAVVFVAMRQKATTLRENPFSGTLYSQKQVNEIPPTKPRESFRVGELNLLFSAPVYKGATLPAKGGRDAAFWLPLLGAFCGARLEDLGWISIGDIREFDGVWYVELGNRKTSNGDTRRRNYRKVPLHEELIKVGLLAYVRRRSLETQGDLGALLFPALTPDGYGNRTKVFSTWFNGYIDKLGLSENRVDFHALRATFQYFAELSGLLAINPDIVDHIVGHTPDMNRMSNHYGRKEGRRKVPPFEQLVQAMKLYRIPGLNLSHLYVNQESVTESAIVIAR